MRVPIAPDVAAVWRQSWVTPLVWPALVSYNLALGWVFLAGGDERINGPSFAAIRVIGPEVTGVAFVVAGAMLLVGAFTGRHVLACAGWFATVLHLLLAAGFVTAVIGEPPPPPPMPLDFIPDPPMPVRAALTGVPTYLFVTVVHAANSALYGRRGPDVPTGNRSAGDQRSQAGEAGDLG